MKRLISLASAALLLTLFAAGCTSSTMLQTVPNGAKVYVNDQYRGTTPYRYSDQKIVGSTTMLRFTLNGYKDLSTQITRDERLHVGALVGGFVCAVPWLWIMRYDAEHIWELEPVAQRPHEIQDNLARLKKLLDDGTISQDEYDQLRTSLLNSPVSQSATE